MRFQFDGNQAYQLRAIEASPTCSGASRASPSTSAPSSWGTFRPGRQPPRPGRSQLLATCARSSSRNGIAADDAALE